MFKGDAIGVLELLGHADEPLVAADARLLQPFADTAAVAIQNARLYEQAGLLFTLAERNRLAGELHVWTLAAPLVDGAALVPALDDIVQRFAARTGIFGLYSVRERARLAGGRLAVTSAPGARNWRRR